MVFEKPYVIYDSVTLTPICITKPEALSEAFECVFSDYAEEYGVLRAMELEAVRINFFNFEDPEGFENLEAMLRYYKGVA